MARPSWLGRAVRNRPRHAIEQASRRWRGGRGDDSTRTLRKILISTQVEQQGLGHFEEAVVSAQNARRLARLCLSYSNRWLEAFENTHRTCAESLTQKGDVNELERQGGDVLAALNASRGSDRTSLNGSRAGSRASSRALRRASRASASRVSRLTPEPAAPASRLGLGRVSQESSLARMSQESSVATGSVVTGPG